MNHNPVFPVFPVFLVFPARPSSPHLFMTAQAPLLSPEHIAMIDKGVSAIVASRNAANRPSLMRAVGAGISADGTEITVYLSRSQSRQLLQDVAATGHVAVVFSEPLSHRLEDTVAVSFVPEQAFDQTPGPRAGSALPAAAP